MPYAPVEVIKTLVPVAPAMLTLTLGPGGIPPSVPLIWYWPGVATKFTPLVVCADPRVTVSD